MDRIRPLLRAMWRRVGPYRNERLWLAALFCLGLPSYLRSRLSRQGVRVREEWPGAVDLGSARDLAVFVHFDVDGHVGAWLEHYLEDLKGAGFAIIFVSNAPRLDADTVARLASHCGLVLRRDNVGHDFGAYRDGLRRVPDLGRVGRLILANDSVYGPFWPIADIVSRMPTDAADVWGITDSHEGRYHLQSYFVLFHATALRTAAFRRFWRRCRYVRSRYWNILMHEIGLTRAMVDAGLTCRALCPDQEAVARLAEHLDDDPGSAALARRSPGSVNPVNPTHELWRVLIAEMRCPFIKRDLLRAGPAGDPDLRNWRDIVAGASAYDTTLIEEQQPVQRS